jgi:magnesium-transporting ATPase (P-type)
MAIIWLNTLIGFVSEMRSAAALDALKQMSKGDCTVIRGGALLSIPIDDIVVGDIMALRDGDCVGADCRVIEAVSVDEAILTGESEVQYKHPDAIGFGHEENAKKSKLLANVKSKNPGDEAEKEKIPIGERCNMIFRQTMVVSNTGLAVVTATGFDTKIGQLSRRLQSSVDDSSDFEKRINRFLFAIFGISLLLVFVIIAIDDFSFSGAILIYSSATSIALLPESILLVVTLICALSMNSLSKNNAIVRRLSVLSTLGTVDVIASDKTGTLTQNVMQVQRIFPWVNPAKQDRRHIKESDLLVIGGGCFTDDRLFYTMPTGFDILAENEMPSEKDWINNPVPFETAQEDCKYINMVSALCNQTLLQYDEDEVAVDINNTEQSKGNNTHKARKLKGTGNATELALAVLSYKLGKPLDCYENDGWYKCGIWPFDSKVKCMSVGYRRNISETDFEALILTKGAPEVLVSKCSNIDEKQRVDILERADHLASQAYRVLAFAIKKVGPKDHFHHADTAQVHYNPQTHHVDIFPPDSDDFVLENTDGHRLQDIDRHIVEDNLTFVGLVAIEDPIKQSSYEVIQQCISAGITPMMLTGDNPKIAAEIARRLGILQPYHNTDDYVITGPTFDALSDEQVDQLPALPLVIARCSPESKVRCVEALQRRGHVVSMNGDGVNDAVALKQANVGAAMGITGTELTKSAADLVLADDKIDTLALAVAEGRHIQQSIKKFVVQLLTGNSSEVTVLLFGLIFRDSQDQVVFPLSPLQILCLNMITSSLIAIALSVEDIDPEIMTYKPETANFLTPEVLIDTAVYGTIVSGLSFASYIAVIFWFGQNNVNGFPVSVNCNHKNSYKTCPLIWDARSTTYAVMTICLLLQGYICRHPSKSIFSMKVFANKTMILCILFGSLLLIPFFYIPWVANNMFKHGAITWEWGIVGVCVAIHLTLSEVYKFFKRLFIARHKNKNAAMPNQGTEMVDLIQPKSPKSLGVDESVKKISKKQEVAAPIASTSDGYEQFDDSKQASYEDTALTGLDSLPLKSKKNAQLA